MCNNPSSESVGISVVGANLFNYDGKVNFVIIVPSLNLAKLRIKSTINFQRVRNVITKMGLHPSQ